MDARDQPHRLAAHVAAVTTVSRDVYSHTAANVRSGLAVTVEDDSVCTIVHVLIDFIHECTDLQCARLSAIVSSPHVAPDQRDIAAAVLRVRHTPQLADMLMLERLKRSHAPVIRTLAGVVARLTHSPQTTDREQLWALVVYRGCERIVSRGIPH